MLLGLCQVREMNLRTLAGESVKTGTAVDLLYSCRMLKTRGDCYITTFKSQSYFNMQMSGKGGGAVLWSSYSIQ